MGTFDMVLVNLEGAEDTVYTKVFQDLARGASTLPHDNEEGRSFLAEHTTLGDDLDGILFSVGPEGSLTVDGFLQVLREQSVPQEAVLEHFLNLSGEGETVRATECRNGLLAF